MSSALSQMVYQAGQPPPWCRITARSREWGLVGWKQGGDPLATAAKLCVDSVSADVSEMTVSVLM